VDRELQALDDRVRLRGLLGAGGMGEVHRAWDERLERPVAVKLLRRGGKAEAERILLEARLQARVEHPHVVKVHEVGTLGGRPCVVLQLVDGGALGRLAPDLPVAELVELVRQAALGLHAAHLQGLVHRDVKPENVLVEVGAGRERSALMSDFGLARAEEGGLSRSGLAPGTLDYMSPEQIAGPGPADRRSDVYALGATLYAVLAGRPPFRSQEPHGGAADDDLRVIRRILEEDPPSLVRAVPGTPRDLSRVIGRAMEKEPAARYPTAEAFAQDLGRWQRGEPVDAVRTGWLERAAKWTRRNRALSRALGVAAAGLLLAGGWALWSAREAGLRALEAARLGAVAEDMEATLRQEHLSPPHDLRPALARLRAEAEELRPAAARGDGPASYALGKALELTGDVEGARAAYQRAWDAGFRAPRVAEGLGTTLGLLYRKAVERDRETLEPEPREQRISALRKELRDPAVRYLSLGGGGGWRLPYLRSTIAMLEGDWAGARASAAEALAADPGRYEARALEAEAWVEEGQQLADEQKLDDAEAAHRRADGPLEEAGRFGRSDPRVPEARARSYLSRATMAVQRGSSPDQEVGQVLSAADAAAALEPDSPVVPALRGAAYLQQVQYAFSARPTDVLSLLGRAAEEYRKAVALDGGEPRTLCRLGRVLYYQAFQLNESGGEGALEAAREGLALVDRAAARAPQDPEVPFIRCLLHHVEGIALGRAGQSRAGALRAVVEAGEEALRRHFSRGVLLRPIMGQALVGLADEALRSGEDPAPDLLRGLDLLDTAYRDLSGQIAVAGQVASARVDAADLAELAGQDPGPHIERALAAAQDALARQPDLAAFQALRAEALAEEASRRLHLGEDPMAAVAEATTLLDRSAAGLDDVAGQAARGQLALTEARWSAGRGSDPGAALARAQRAFEALVARHPQRVEGHEGLARCALERARWAARRGGPAAAAAREGLERVERALSRDPGDLRLAILRAELVALSGDREAARRDLEAAWARNPRVRGSWESRAAEEALR
jgi:hypothetical protein